MRDHHFTRRYTWTKAFPQTNGLLEAAPHRGAHRRKRPRRPMAGMMLHQDASRHLWVAGEPACDLVVTLDDATGAICSAILVPEEGTASTFAGLPEAFTAHGLPSSLHTDRGSHHFHTPVVGGRVSERVRTQVGRAPASWGSSTSRLIRSRRAAGPNRLSARCRTGCPRRWRWLA